MYLKDLLKVCYTGTSTSVDHQLTLGGILVVASMLSSMGCIVSFLIYGPGIGLRLMLADTLLLFIVIWAKILYGADEKAPYD